MNDAFVSAVFPRVEVQNKSSKSMRGIVAIMCHGLRKGGCEPGRTDNAEPGEIFKTGDASKH